MAGLLLVQLGQIYFFGRALIKCLKVYNNTALKVVFLASRLNRYSGTVPTWYVPVLVPTPLVTVLKDRLPSITVPVSTGTGRAREKRLSNFYFLVDYRCLTSWAAGR